MARSAFPLKPASRLPTKVFAGHTDRVWSIAYFHDWKRIISGSSDKTVRIWDVENQKQDGESLMHEFGVQCMALSPDERRLVSGGEGVVVWDLEGRTVMWKRDEVDGMCVAYSPDGRLIAASHYEAIELLNEETGERIRDPLQFVENECLAFSPDRTRIAAGSPSGDVQVFDVATGETIVGLFKAHTDDVMSLIYTFDGQQIITASVDKSIRVWDAATGQETGDPMLGHERSIWQIALSDDGRRLASSSTDSTVRVWDLNTRQQIGGPLRTQDGRFFTSSVWSPDGRSIVTGDSVGNIYLWDAPSLDDHSVIPQVATPIAPLPSASLSRANFISSSILNLPAGSRPPNQAPATNRLPDDFFHSSPDLPGRAHNQISTIPIATVPSRPSIPNTTKPKTDPKTPSTSAPSLQPLGHASPQSSGHAAPQSSGRTTPASSHNAMPTSSHYAMPTSPGSVAEQLIQNIRWTG